MIINKNRHTKLFSTSQICILCALFLFLLSSCAQSLNGKIFPNPEGDCGTLHWEYDSKSGELILTGEMTQETHLDSEDGFNNVFPTSSVKKINIDNCVVAEIPDNQFKNFENVEKFTIPDTVVYVGHGAFEGWGKGQEIKLAWNSTDTTTRNLPGLDQVGNNKNNRGGSSVKVVTNDGVVIHGQEENNSENRNNEKCNVTFENGVLTIFGTDYTEIRMNFIDENYVYGGENKQSYYAGRIDVEYNIEHEYNPHDYDEWGRSDILSINGDELKEIKFIGSITRLRFMENNLYIASLPNLETVTLNEGLQHIEDFPNFSDLVSLTIPFSVTKIENSIFGDWMVQERDDRTIYLNWTKDDTTERDINILFEAKAKIYYIDGTPFEQYWTYEESNIKYTLFSSGTLTITTDGELVLDGSTITNVISSMTNYDKSWYDVKNIVFEGNITKISTSDNYNFSSIETVTLQETLQELGEQCFYYWYGLKEITIPSSVTKIGSIAFENWSSSSQITLDWPSDDTTERNFASEWLNYCNATVLYNDGIPAKGMIAEYDSDLRVLTILGTDDITITSSKINYQSNVDKIEFKGRITSLSIDNDAKSYLYDTTTVILPENLQNIVDSCFKGFGSLTSITIPSSVTTIGSSAFQNCTSLETVELSTSLSKLSNSAFSGCSNLKTIEIPSTVTEFGQEVFTDCTSIDSLTIPSSVTIIGDYCFAGWENTQTIILDWTSDDLTDHSLETWWNDGCNANIVYKDGALYN